MAFPLHLLSIPTLCLAQATALPQPRLVFDNLHHDFGQIDGKSRVTHAFKVTNEGKGLVHILHLQPSCGCTTALLGQGTLAPGESTNIAVTFDPEGVRGVALKSIKVVSDDPGRPLQTLTFEAEIRQEVMASTGIVFFHDVARSSPRKTSVKVETTNDVPVRILEVQAQKPAPYLTVNSRPDGKNAWVDLAFNGREVPADQQVGTETIIVRTSNASVPTLPILVQWDLLSAVSVEPANVVWVETAGLAHKATLTLTQTSGKPFRILSARTTHPLLQVDLGEKGASAIHRIQMGLAAEAKAGAYTEKVRLTLDDPDQPELEIRVSAALR